MAAARAKKLATQAEDLAEVGDTAGAIAKYEAAVREDPGDAMLQMKLESLRGGASAMDELFAQMAANKREQQTVYEAPPDPAQPLAPELREDAEQLCRCAEKGDVPGLRRLLAKGADVNTTNALRYGDRALHFAKDAKTARALLDAGAAVDAGGSNPTWTPLLAALRFGRLDVAKLLLASGADATVGDGERPGRNALFVVTSGSALDGAERLEAATLLVAGGADAAACERSTEWTALHDAAVNDDRGVARLLLEHGANVNATSTKTLMWDAGGRVTPYDVAVGSAFDDLAAMLAGFGGARFGDLHCYAGPQGRI